MKLIKLTLENFGPYKGIQEIAFPTDEQRPVMVVYGDNMRGKTSFLNAIRWCLYGQALDRLSRELDLLKLINLEAQREQEYRMAVRMTFSASGSEYELARSVEPLEYVAVPKSNAHFRQDVWLKRNGNALRADEVELCINSFIPHQVSRFYLFDGELLQEYETLLVEDSQHGQRIKDAIEQVLGVPALVNGRDESKDLLKKAQAIQVRELKHIDALASYTSQSQSLQNQIEAHEADLLPQRAHLQTCIGRLDEIDGELASTAAIQETHARLKTVAHEMQEIKAEQISLEQQKVDCVRLAWRDLLQPRLDLRRRELHAKLESFQNALQRRGGLDDRIQRLERVLTLSVCPTCDSPVNETRRIALAEEQGTLRAELQTLQVDIFSAGELSRELSALHRLTGTSALTELRRIESRLQKQSVALTKLENLREELDEHLRGHDMARVATLQKEKDGLLKLRGRIEGTIEGVIADIDDKKRRVNHIAVLMSKNPEGRRQRSSLEVNAYSALEQVFSKSIDILRDRLREKVAEEATRVFKSLTTEKTYSGLQINQNYGLSILDKDGRLLPVRSAGAEQIVAMSLLGALNRVVNRPGPLIVDTPFGRLDPKHRLNILRFIPQMAEQIVFLVHEGEVSKDIGLAPISDRIAVVYEIQRVSATHSVIARG